MIVNELIVALANRTSGFEMGALNVAQEFVSVQDRDVNRLRTFLLPDDRDLWVLSLYQVVMGDHYVSTQVDAQRLTFDFSCRDYLHWGFDVSSTETTPILIRGGEGGPYVGPAADKWPVNNRIKLDISHPPGGHIGYEYHVRLTWEGHAAAGDYESSIEPVGSRLRLNWAGAPVTGDLFYYYDRVSLDTVVLNAPFHYPVGEIASGLESQDGFVDLLVRHGLADAFYFADSPQEKVAVAGLVLYKAYKEVQRGG